MQEQLAGWTARVRAYQDSGAGKRDLLEDLGKYVYAYPRRKYPYLEEDTAGEFYLFCHAKLERMLARFRDQGKPFERYLNSVLSWQLRTFLARRRQREQAWETGLRSQVWDPQADLAAAHTDPAATHTQQPATDTDPGAQSAPALPQPPSAAADAVPATCRRPRPGLPAAPLHRRVLYAALKAGHEMDDAMLTAAAQLADCDEQWLRAQVARLHRGRSAVQRRFTVLRERRNSAFAQLQLWQADAVAESDPERRARATARADRLRRTVSAARRELARVHLGPSNREIGAALGVPKGTVDTGLFWLKREISSRYAPLHGTGVRQQQSA